MKVFGICLVVLGGGLLLALLVAAPYVFYVGARAGWLDERITWAPMGVPGALLGMALAKLGLSLMEGK